MFTFVSMLYTIYLNLSERKNGEGQNLKDENIVSSISVINKNEEEELEESKVINSENADVSVNEEFINDEE